MISMLSPEIYTEEFKDTLVFYQNLGFEPTDEAFGFRRMDGFVPLVIGNDPSTVLYVCEAYSPEVDALFRPPFRGEGLILQLVTDDVEGVYRRVCEQKADIALSLRDDGGNGRHFAVRDPNGIIVDIAEFRGRDHGN